MEDERYRLGIKVLVDHTAQETIQYSPSDLREVIDRVVAMKDMIKGGYCAIVVPTPVVYGAMRIWATEIESATKARIRLFRSREDALAWLREIDVGGEGVSGA